jgi:hypothetical protein
VTGEQAGRTLNLQGVQMGRPGRIHNDIGTDGGRFTHVNVGGSSVAAGEGSLFISDPRGCFTSSAEAHPCWASIGDERGSAAAP